MKNTVSKGILFYIFLLIAVVLGVLCVIGAVLVFSPGTEIFGISYYVNVNSQSVETAFDDNQNKRKIDDLFDQKQIETINITTNYANVSVETRQDNFVEFIIEPSLTGLITSENKDTFSYYCSYSPNTKTLSITVTSPTMLLAFNDTIDVVLSLPETITETNLNLNVITQSGNLTLGNRELDDYSLKSVSIIAENSSNVTFGINAGITNKISVNVPSGNIRFKKDISTNYIDITSKSAKIETKNITAYEMTINTEGSSIKMEDITVETIFNYSARRGILMIDNLNGNLNNSEEVIISNITIGEVNGDVLLPNADSSDITIESLNGTGAISTKSGNVTINKASGFLWITTQSGKIEVNVETAETFDTTSYDEDQGIINLETQSGRINVVFENLLLKNYIKTTSGKIDCNISPTLNLIIDYDCSKNVPTLSTGLSNGEITNQGSITMGSSNTNNHIIISNEKGNTSIQDTYVVKQ